MLKKYLFEPNYRVLCIYRLSEKLLDGGKLSRILAYLLRNHLKVKYSIEFNNIKKIGKNLTIFHFNGIVIGYGCTIGENLTIYNQVTIGGKRMNGETKYPVIGDNVTIYPGARVVGDIKVGSGSVIGPNVVVYKDLPENTTVLNKNMDLIFK